MRARGRAQRFFRRLAFCYCCTEFLYVVSEPIDTLLVQLTKVWSSGRDQAAFFIHLMTG